MNEIMNINQKLSKVTSSYFVVRVSRITPRLDSNKGVSNQALEESTCLYTTWQGQQPFVACVFGSLHPFKLRVIHVSFTNGLQSHSQGKGFSVLFWVSQANFETTCDDTGGATIENTLQDVTGVAPKGPNLLLQSCFFCIMLKLLRILEKIDFRKF